MTLRQKRDVFNKMWAQLLLFAIEKNIPLEQAEGFRPRWLAVKYALEKVGIVNSKHCSSLAHDAWITSNEGGKILWDDPRYETLADKWSAMGGIVGIGFKRKDAYHFEL